MTATGRAGRDPRRRLGDEKKRIVGARGKSQLLSEVEPFIG